MCESCLSLKTNNFRSQNAKAIGFQSNIEINLAPHFIKYGKKEKRECIAAGFQKCFNSSNVQSRTTNLTTFYFSFSTHETFAAANYVMADAIL